MVLAVALLLGLRHASDPDHLGRGLDADRLGPERRRASARDGSGSPGGWGTRSRSRLFGLPIVLFGAYLPESVQRAAEARSG